MITYIPEHRMLPPKTVEVDTAWKEVAPVVESILDQFNVERDNMLEFGVDYGYSTVIFSNFFKHVVGVDHFLGDGYAGFRNEKMYSRVMDILSPFQNISLVPMDYQEFIRDCDADFDFIHVDIVHTYAETFECGDWAVQHAPVVMFHDTIAFHAVMMAVEELSAKWDMLFYHVPEQHGIGILARKER